MCLHHVDTGLHSLKEFADRPLFIIGALCFGGNGLWDSPVGIFSAGKYVSGKVMFSEASVCSGEGVGNIKCIMV